MNMRSQWTHPDLEFDPLVITVNCFYFEVNPNSADKRVTEWVVCISEQKAGFSHTAVAYNEELEHVVKVLVGAISLSKAVICFCHL